MNTKKGDYMKFKAVLDKVGCKFVGIQEGCDGEKFVMFNERVQGSTLAVPVGKFSLESVQKKVREFALRVRDARDTMEVQA